ncbi:MAG: DUF2946 family protein [Alphaproteobacteria bacterium]|nr:DUF2946 family protein [Alphaproteobacteria bacterium]
MFALVALLVRLGVGSMMPAMPTEATLADLFGPGVICHAPGETGQANQAPVDQRDHACPVCPLCLAAHAPVGLVAAPVLPMLMAQIVAARFIMPVATAPPSSRFTIARPRGPPAPLHS